MLQNAHNKTRIELTHLLSHIYSLWSLLQSLNTPIYSNMDYLIIIVSILLLLLPAVLSLVDIQIEQNRIELKCCHVSRFCVSDFQCCDQKIR
jgi:hypothetical protein